MGVVLSKSESILDQCLLTVPEGVLDRLLNRLTPAEPREDLDFPCLEWTGSTTANGGHGMIHAGSRIVIVHRLMWALCNRQEIPDGLLVLHGCDNPRCCEPTHLRLGTHGDNVADRVQRGRSARGIRNGRSKLTPDNVRDIRRRHREPVGKLAREFGVDPRAIRAILRREIWKTVQ